MNRTIFLAPCQRRTLSKFCSVPANATDISLRKCICWAFHFNKSVKISFQFIISAKIHSFKHRLFATVWKISYWFAHYALSLRSISSCQLALVNLAAIYWREWFISIWVTHTHFVQPHYSWSLNPHIIHGNACRESKEIEIWVEKIVISALFFRKLFRIFLFFFMP